MTDISSDIRALYQETILDHYKHPRNFGKLESANRKAEGYNPLCGDKMVLYLEMKEDIIQAVRFEASGCAISTASASLMTEMLVGKTKGQAQALADEFHDLLMGKGEGKNLDKLIVLSGVKDYPVRIKCAILAWHALTAALKNENKVVTTE